NGTPAAAQIVRDADLVIAIGTRLTDFVTGSQSAFQHPDVRFIAINVCPHDAYKQGALPIVADACETLTALTNAADGITTDATYRAEISAAKEAWAAQLRDEVYVQIPGEAMSQGQLI